MGLSALTDELGQLLHCLYAVLAVTSLFQWEHAVQQSPAYGDKQSSQQKLPLACAWCFL